MARRNRRGRSNMYGLAPTINRRLTQFNKPHHLLTSMGVGKLYPIDVREVLPGSVCRSSLNTFSRLTSTFIRPIMDDIYLDVFEFFVPLRLCQANLEDVFGNNSPSAYSEDDLASIAHLTEDETSGATPIDLRGTVWDYLGLCNIHGLDGTDADDYPSEGTSILPIRAFALIWNEYFRNQNVTAETYVSLSDTVASAELPNTSDWSETNYAGMLPPVTRFKDYFSTALPAAQKGPAVNIPIFTSANPEFIGLTLGVDSVGAATGQTLTVDGLAGYGFSRYGSYGDIYTDLYKGNVGFSFTDEDGSNFDGSPDYVSVKTMPDQIGTISDLRLATQLQRYRERDAWYGTRYREYLYAAYGVSSPDARLQVPEFLGKSHTRLNVSQVMAATQSTDYDLGQVAGQSVTLSNPSCRWRKSFTEHGYVVTVACIRYRHLYSQGVRRMFSRTEREHFYDPLFANVGMARVFKSELIQEPDELLRADSQLGFQEPWLEYRTLTDRVSGQMRPYDGSLGAFWSLADSFDVTSSQLNLRTLAYEDDQSFERVISAPDSSGIDPFIVDFRWDQVDALPVPAWSVPGRMDH